MNNSYINVKWYSELSKKFRASHDMNLRTANVSVAILLKSVMRHSNLLMESAMWCLVAFRVRVFPKLGKSVQLTRAVSCIYTL